MTGGCALLHRPALQIPSKYSSTCKINTIPSYTNQCHINDALAGKSRRLELKQNIMC